MFYVLAIVLFVRSVLGHRHDELDGTLSPRWPTGEKSGGGVGPARCSLSSACWIWCGAAALAGRGRLEQPGRHGPVAHRGDVCRSSCWACWAARAAGVRRRVSPPFRQSLRLALRNRISFWAANLMIQYVFLAMSSSIRSMPNTYCASRLRRRWAVGWTRGCRRSLLLAGGVPGPRCRPWRYGWRWPGAMGHGGRCGRRRCWAQPRRSSFSAHVRHRHPRHHCLRHQPGRVADAHFNPLIADITDEDEGAQQAQRRGCFSA